MFEGVVSQVLAGFLRRYVKGIQKDQLKIGLWNEEVLLENVELILEAFDYLQLPFALKNGRVGKLSIKIPWKKLGWDPIIVVLEDVFICACQREDSEWSSESVERRELAGKMAKLNAVELAKFSRRVCDNHAGQSFVSFISAKILDNIQVSVQNVDIIYVDSPSDQEKFIFGLRFSSLTILTDTRKQSFAGSSTGKLRGGQVSKIVEISNAGLYCNLFQENQDMFFGDDTTSSQLCSNLKLDHERCEYIISPFDVTLSLLANKIEKLDGAPRYDTSAELNTLVVSLTEIQLRRILRLWDYFSICALRKKYGRYRPSQSSLSRKLKGWQKIWWHYAQQSVLADVRERLKKTSWSNLGERITCRRKYVNLYKRKLGLLQQEQNVSKDILQELERMDREYDIDDILSYRSLAEQQMQELLLNSKSSNIEANYSKSTQEKRQNDEQSSSRAHGWLNWLSLGMLGAGGTADTSSFAGVVSDEIIKDIYEATDFHLTPSSSGDSSVRDKICLSSIKLNICRLIISISTKSVAKAVFDDIGTECKFWEDMAAILVSIGSLRIINPWNENVMLMSKKAIIEDSLTNCALPFIDVQINMPQSDQNSEVLVKVVFQPFEATYESDFFLYILHFYHVIASFQFQHDRVLSSLNGLRNLKARLLSKFVYLSSNRKKLHWDISFHNVTIKLPLKNGESYVFSMVSELEALFFRSRHETDNGSPLLEDRECYDLASATWMTDSTVKMPLNFQLHDLYEHFEIGLTGFAVKKVLPDAQKVASVVEKFDACVVFGRCFFLDEPMFKQLKIDCVVPYLGMHFSQAIFNALVKVCDSLLESNNKPGLENVRNITEVPDNRHSFRFSVSVKFDKLNVKSELEDDENSSVISFGFWDVGIRHAVLESVESWILVKTLKVDAFNLMQESDSVTVFLSRDCSGSKHSNLNGVSPCISLPGLTCRDSSFEGCLRLQYQARRDEPTAHHDYHLCLNDVDLHVHPKIFGLLQSFLDRLKLQSSSSGDAEESTAPIQKDEDMMTGVNLSKFGFSNFYDSEQLASASIPVDRFPFVSLGNSRFVNSLEGSLVLDVPELRSMYVKEREYGRSTNVIARRQLRNMSPTLKSPTSCNLFTLDGCLNGVQIHFHDSSCVLGTITAPVAISYMTFHGTDCWDILFSCDGLIISSSWSSPNINELLWGPSSPSFSPVLNFHVRKKGRELLHPLTEISIGIQHVCCILPSEYLALVIGYFSLPEWACEGTDHCTNESDRFEKSQNVKTDLAYRFEILDSALILPVEEHIDYYLLLEFPQLVSSFIPSSSLADAARDIPSGCMISGCSIADRVDIINVFGRSASLSLLLLKKHAELVLNLEEYKSDRRIPLIAQLDSDVWIRLPCETKCSIEQSPIRVTVMVKIIIGNLIAQDDYVIHGLEAAVDVLDQFTLVRKQSKMYRSDISQFLQLKSNIKENNGVSIDISNASIFSLKFFAEALSLVFYQSGAIDFTSSEMVAKADMRLYLTAVSRNGIPEFIDVEVLSLVLHSFYSHVLLVSFISDGSLSTRLCINFSSANRGKAELLVAIPSLDMWLHLSDWNNLVDHFCSYTKDSMSTSCPSSVNQQSASHSVPDSSMSPCFAAEYDMQKDVHLTVKSDNISISLHVPLQDREKYLTKSEVIVAPKFYSQELPNHKLAENMLSFESNHYKYVKFTLQSKNCELAVGESFVKAKCSMEKVKAMLEMVQNHKIISFPFVNISQVKLGANIQKKQGELLHIFLEVQVESLDVGFSHQIFNFWSRCLLKIPETSSSNSCHCMVLVVHLKKCSLLLSDGRWSCHGPILETLMKNILVQLKHTEDAMEASVVADLLINYNNIDKVMWEPFIEPWSFQLNFVRKFVGSIVLSTSRITDVCLRSTRQLNLNFTEPLIEAIFRLNQMIKDAFSHNGTDGFQESQGVFRFQNTGDIHTRRYAPYILRNDTSLPLRFQVYCCPVSVDEVDSFSAEEAIIVQPGFSVPIYVEETIDEQFFQHRKAHSSEKLMERKMNAVAHHMISIQFDGTSWPSKPMSMDLVGVSYFEVNFSKSKQSAFARGDEDGDSLRYSRMSTEQYKSDQNDGLVVPVVFDVSMQHYSKMIRLYSTVILFNATSVPLELRFDIPFGVSSKVLGPILPGQEIPLPLHLAEAGRIRWHPVGTSYLWSEAHSLSNILSQESRIGFLRSFVCYPSHPSSDPFRCCISIQDYNLFSSDGVGKCSNLNIHGVERPFVNRNGQRNFGANFTRKRFIRHVRLTTPLQVKSYLPACLSLTIDSSGVAHSCSLSEAETAAVFLVDSAHDLGITFSMQGFDRVISKFPRAELFSAMAKLNGSKFSLSETLTFYPVTSGGPIYVTLDKTMDAFCGAREMCLSVPFLLYNCTGLSLTVVDSNPERKGISHVIPSSYAMTGIEQLLSGKYGLDFIFSEVESSSSPLDISSLGYTSENRTLCARENYSLYSHRLLTRHYSSASYSHSDSAIRSTHGNFMDSRCASNRIQLSSKVGDENTDAQNEGNRKAKAYMYSPVGQVPAAEMLVKLSVSWPLSRSESSQNSAWSDPFSLVPASGSTNVVIPQPYSSGAFLISATSISVSGELSGKTRAVIFQPRYVICNACNRDLCYRQKGTNNFYHLGVGQHSHLHWSDTTRELLVSIRFNEPGWQWSGSFLPDHLGDAQVKMRNYVSGASSMVRVEVQNADLAVSNEDIIWNSKGNSMTQLILLSDDRTGFMPYRIDNFSMERLRIYQQMCESFETVVHSYTSCQYAWDEPCYPHRLIVEVPGERILGTYSLDNVKEYVPVYLRSTSEKPERRLHISVHAEGAIKVLSVIDSSHHIVKDMKETGFFGLKENKDVDQKQEYRANFTEMVTLQLPFLGISLINSSPQELVFICAKETTIVAMQSLDQQKISFKILSLQVDNQLSNTPYPIMLSSDNESRGRSTTFLKNKGNKFRFQNENINPTSDSTLEPIFYLTASKWRNADKSLVSFEYISLGLAPLCIELEEQVLLNLFDFFRAVSSRLQSRSLQKSLELWTLGDDRDALIERPTLDCKCNNMSSDHEYVVIQKNNKLLPSVVPIGAPWQEIYLLARKQKKIYAEAFELAPIILSLSFSSSPWMIRNEFRGDVESFAHISGTAFQRGLMAFVDVEGVPVHLRQLTLEHLMASPESIQEILIRHYTRQLLHETYKVFGSAGVIGNPMGFARNVGLGIKDFLSVSGRGILQSPGGLLTSVAQGSKSLIFNTVYAISSATTQFSKSAHKGIVAFTYDEQAAFEMDEQRRHLDSHGKGVLNEFLEGLTGLLQSPIRGAEKHGLPGVLSGIAIGTAGLVARPMASILEATGKTAQSIRIRSSPHQSKRLRIRFPRPLVRDAPLMPYNWEEAIGVSVLLQADSSRLKDEVFLTCKALKQAGKFIIISERLVLVVWSSCLVGLGSPEFVGVPPDPGWVIETEMSLESVVHVDRTEEVVNIVGSNAERLSKQKKGVMKNRPWNPRTSIPLFHVRVELPAEEEAEDALQVLLSTIEQGKLRRWGVHVLHRSSLR